MIEPSDLKIYANRKSMYRHPDMANNNGYAMFFSI